MSTSEENGKVQLTRKQLREIRLTGSTPVISEEEAAAAVAPPTTVLPRAAEPIEIAPAPVEEQPHPSAPLTRRQMRALEHAAAAAQHVPAADDATPAPTPEPAPATAEQVRETVPPQGAGLVSGLPTFTEAPAPAPRFEAAPEADPAPLSTDRDRVVGMFERPAEVEQAPEPTPAAAPRKRIVPEVMGRGLMTPGHVADEAPIRERAEPDAVEPKHAEPEHVEPKRVEPEAAQPAVVEPERPKVGAAFGIGVQARSADSVAGARFDDVLDGTVSNSQHGASTALIFTPSPGLGSLSGPIASTGEILVTGTYALPDGLGSQGHALGAADGRAADAGFMDSELAPASSPTPIAASSAVSTSRPAGEVIRPLAPDKSNKLMITLAIVAGGLAIVLAATLVIAFTTGVFG
ncbi:hypothetical protein [uncultured Microbacterium sp.]|uniref:hypothetical protein n=1 Tax=uncultured Microbacterium sp. TaxID=191216 RepID=UPI0026336E4C|nr:hypothetical protein [uncultured Microbacterium sp.]